MSHNRIRRALIVDNFAGGGGASLGLMQALGRPVDIAINHNAYALAIHAKNHPETKHLVEDVFDVDPEEACEGHPVDWAWFSPDCFPAGTLVLTKTGYRPIETLVVGDWVLSHRLLWQRVTTTFKTRKKLLRIRGHGHFGLEVSGEHPFLTRRRERRWSNSPRGYRHSFLPEEWTKAGDLRVGHYWATPKVFPLAAPPAIPGRALKIDANLMRLVGCYLGNGSSRLDETHAELVVTCGKHAVERFRNVLNRWPRRGGRSGDGELAWQERDTQTAHNFTTSHRGLVPWLLEHFGKGAGGKRLPAWVLGLSEELRAAVLEGYLMCDGNLTADTQTYSSVSKALLFGVKDLAGSLGYSPTTHLGRPAGPAVIEGRTVNTRQMYRGRWRPNPDPVHAQVFRDPAGPMEWCPIRKVEQTGRMATVYNIGVEEDESYIVEGIVVHNCTHHSKAKGGKPVNKNIRALADIVPIWMKKVNPRIVGVENVEEIKSWGPLRRIPGKPGWYPDPAQRGKYFEAWLRRIKRCGYKYEYRTLHCHHYGVPTSRKRFFLLARNDGKPISWPEPTHGPGLLPYRSAAECIDWSLPCKSIFDRPKPLAEKTLRRIALGIKRYVLDSPEPFLVKVNHGDKVVNDFRGQPLSIPMATITGTHGTGLVVPHLAYFRGDSMGRDIEMPMPAITSGAGAARPAGAPHALGLVECAVEPYGRAEEVAAFLSRYFGGPRNTGATGRDMREQMPTVTAIDHNAVVAVNMVRFNHGDKQWNDVREPATTITTQGNKLALVYAFLVKYLGTAIGSNIAEPMHTATSKHRFGLVLVYVKGEPFVIVDIGLRILEPRELANAMGFPPEYVFEGPKYRQVAAIGNSVPPPMVKALVEANNY